MYQLPRNERSQKPHNYSHLNKDPDNILYKSNRVYYPKEPTEEEKQADLRRQLYGPPKRRRVAMTHARMESNTSAVSNVTTNSELNRRELLLVPAPLNLTPKVYQPPLFANTAMPQTETLTRYKPLRKTDRYSRLREVSNAQEEVVTGGDEMETDDIDDYYYRGPDTVEEYEAVRHEGSLNVGHEDETFDSKHASTIVSVDDRDSTAWLSDDSDTYSMIRATRYNHVESSETAHNLSDEVYVKAGSLDESAYEDSDMESDLPLEISSSKRQAPGADRSTEQHYANHLQRASFTDEGYENYYGNRSSSIRSTEDSALPINDVMDLDNDVLPTPVREDRSSFLGGSSITTIQESPMRYDDGRNVGLPSSSPQRPLTPSRHRHAVFAQSSEISSSPPVSRNLYQAEWDLEKSKRDGIQINTSVEEDTHPNNALRVPGGEDVSQLTTSDVRSEISRILSTEITATTFNTTMTTPIAPKPLTFGEIQILQAASKILRGHGHEESFINFLAAIGIGAAAAMTCDELEQRYAHQLRTQMNDSVPGDYRPVSEGTSIGEVNTRRHGQTYNILPPTSPRLQQKSPYSQPAATVSFSLPADCQQLPTTKEPEVKQKSLRKKISMRDGLANLFSSHSKRPAAEKVPHRSSDEVKKRRGFESDEFRPGVIVETEAESETRAESVISGLTLSVSQRGIQEEERPRRARRDIVISFMGGLV